SVLERFLGDVFWGSLSRLEPEPCLKDVAKVTCRGIPVFVRMEKSGDLDVVRETLAGDMYRLERYRALRVGTILDVGAHIGTFVLYAKTLWPEARVLAVEPNPRSNELLRLNTSCLEDVETYQIALRYDGANVLTDGEGTTGGGFVA